MAVTSSTVKTATSIDTSSTAGATSANSEVESTYGMDDGNKSNDIITTNYTIDQLQDANTRQEALSPVKRAHGIYDREDIDIFNERYRFGLFNPYQALSTTREYLFFTKPDLNIMERDDTSGTLTSTGMNSTLVAIPYWRELRDKYDDVIKCLQLSYGGKKDPFNHLLENMCMSNLSVPGLDAELVDTPTNAYGVGYNYRGSSEASNDGFDFDLEFKDTRYLPVYHFFKAYEEYETLKHHGTIGPWRGYIENKVLHDQFAIYKFLVDEDMETIVYYAKFYGVFPKSLPRDVFSSSSFDSGLSYSVSFRAAFFDDMDPQILNDFNAISGTFYYNQDYRIDIYNDKLGRIDNRPAKAAYITSAYDSHAPGNTSYKLKWRGDLEY